MKLTTKIVAAWWFSLGTIISISAIFFKMHGSEWSILSVIAGILSGAIAGYYLGYQWGSIILFLSSWKVKNWITTIGEGLMIGFLMIYWILFVLGLLSYVQTNMIYRITAHQYLSIVGDLLLLPLSVIFATIFIGFFKPILLGIGPLWAVILFLLRKPIGFLVNKS